MRSTGSRAKRASVKWLVTPWVPLPRPSRGTWRKEWLGDVELAATENAKPVQARQGDVDG